MLLLSLLALRILARNGNQWEPVGSWTPIKDPGLLCLFVIGGKTSAKKGELYDVILLPRLRSIGYSNLICRLLSKKRSFFLMWRSFGFAQWWEGCRYWRMSCAQSGYVDPSSTDKGAADETNEVDLQVLAWLEKVWYYASLPLCLGMTCGGWCRTCEKKHVLEGVTKIEGAMPGTYLRYLPRSLARFTFGRNFNQNLNQVTLPSRLQSLSFSMHFNQSLENVTLPSNLKSLSFGQMFNQTLDQVTLPSSLQSLSFSMHFNQSLEHVSLPSNLKSLSFGQMFNQTLEQVTLPSSLQSLSFGMHFIQSL